MVLRKYKNLNECSLNDFVSADKEGNTLTREETISDNTDMAQEYVEKDEVNYFRNIVIKIIEDKNILNEKEKKAVILKYGIGTDKALTENEISKELNVSRSYVSRLSQTAVNKIKKAYNKMNKDSSLDK